MTPKAALVFCLLGSAVFRADAMFGSKAAWLMKRNWASIPEEHLDPLMVDEVASGPAALVEKKPEAAHTGGRDGGELKQREKPEHAQSEESKARDMRFEDESKVQEATEDLKDTMKQAKDSLMNRAKDALTELLKPSDSSPAAQFKAQEKARKEEQQLLKEREKEEQRGPAMIFTETDPAKVDAAHIKAKDIDKILVKALPVKDLKIAYTDGKLLRQSFAKFDKNGDSVLTPDDLRLSLNEYGAESGQAELGNSVPEIALQRILDHVDQDHDGHVILRDYQRYLEAVVKNEQSASRRTGGGASPKDEKKKGSFISTGKKQDENLLRGEGVALAVDSKGEATTAEKPKKKPVHLMMYSTVPLRDAQQPQGGVFAQKQDYVYGHNTPQAQHAADFSEEHARLLYKDAVEKQGYEEAQMIGVGTKWLGWGSKISSALVELKKVPAEQLVVLSDSYDVLINPRKDQGPEDFEQTFKHLTRNYPSAVVVAGEADCCNAAMNVLAEPGSLIDKKGNRKDYSCSSGIEHCTHGAPEGDDAWKSFMQVRAVQHGHEDTLFPYVGSGLIAGHAKDLIRVFEYMKHKPTEDDQALLTETMYRKPDWVLVDYDQKLFGTNRPILGEEGCIYDVDEKGELAQTGTRVSGFKPFMVHTGGRFWDCYNKLTKALQYEERAFKEGDVTLVQGHYGDPNRQLGALLLTLPFQPSPKDAALSVNHRLMELIDQESQ